MLKYDLLGQTVVFEDAAERYYDLWYASNQACFAASQQFSTWYKQCGNIQAVLDGYLPFVESLADQLVFRPLFSQLPACEIYDMSEESYWKHCIGLGKSESALETVEKQYNAILKKQNAEKEYRADRKAGRGHYKSYTSFHSDYWLRNQAEAGMKNIASFAGHTLWNAVGNAGSALSASMSKSALYNNSATQDTLLNGILTDLFTAYYAHMDFLNERQENYIQSIFDEDKSNALFENAKNLPDKRNGLLLQAFTLCPWNEELVKYTFVNYPDDRDMTYAAAQRFSIDLSDTVEEILAQEYDEAAQFSEAATQEARGRILHHMQKYGVTESPTLDKLETDCLHRLCSGYPSADEAACNQLIEEVRQYEAQEGLKEPFFAQLEQRITDIWLEELEGICQELNTADEDACGHCLDEINRHKAPKELKESFQSRVHDRVQIIWREELSEICRGLDMADEASCGQRRNAIEQHKAPEHLKAPFLQKIQQRIQAIWTNELAQICNGYETADEAACEARLAAIKNHKAPTELKSSFLQKIQTRIESIWSAEDGEIFDNLYMKTDITDPKAVAEAVTYVQSKGRTDSSKKYLDALNGCTPKNIKKAQLYYNTKYYKTYIILAILSIIGTAFLAVTWILAIPLFYMAWNMKKAWKLLTINDTMLHPALLSAPSQVKPKKR
jgi:hypothetical protein